MAIINSSKNLYGAIFRDASFSLDLILDAEFIPDALYPFVDAEIFSDIKLDAEFSAESLNPFVDAEIDGEIELGATFAADARSPYVDAEIDGEIFLDASFAAAGGFPGDAEFSGDLILEAAIEPVASLALVEPPPITTTVGASAFSNQRYAGSRLFINGVITPFVRAELNAPAKALGKTLRIELARADLSQLPANATFKFEIGRIVSGVQVWTTLLDGGKLEGRQFSMSVNRDSLSFSTTAGTDKLNKCPKNNFIVFDPAKTSVETSELEAIPTNTNEFVGTSASAISVLSLNKILNIAFVSGCGFNSVVTDIPNYEIARCDFSVASTYAAAVAPFIGMYEPEFSIDSGNNLTIRKTINPLPISFVPNAIYALLYPSFTESADYQVNNLDGFLINYTARPGTAFVDRNEPDIVQTSGTFGEADFIETTTKRKVRDWYEDGAVVRTELKSETITTRRSGEIVGRETKINSFDALGRSTGYQNTLEARMPDVNNDGQPALLKTREETQKIAYKTNPFNSRQTVTSKIETSVRGLMAIDADNTALDENGEDSPYAQDYEKVFEAGNLTKAMTSAFQTLENNVQYFRPLANGQIECRTECFDALRGKPKPPISDVRSGDISVGNFTKQKTRAVFKAGVTQATRTGKPLQPLNVGELPLVFAEPLADWILANGRISASVELVGFDESIERGVFFNLRNRENASFGNYLISGYRVIVEPKSIMTTVDALKV